MKRKLFCELSPLTYQLSVYKCRAVRGVQNCFSGLRFARQKSTERLPVVLYKQNALEITEHPLAIKYHIKVEDEQFVVRGADTYRTGKIYRECVDVRTGRLLEKRLIKENNAKLMYRLDAEKRAGQQRKKQKAAQGESTDEES